MACLFGGHQAIAQGTTAFTYQGQLRDGGTNANGTYTMQFKLYDALTGGNQIGSAIINSPTLVNGLFSVNLDFGAGAFTGNARWLDITVTNGGAAQTLSPRVQVLPTPYAQFAAVAAVAATAPNGVSLGGTNYVPNIQVFGGGSSGTFVVPTNVTRVMVEVWGGGGGGGAGYYFNGNFYNGYGGAGGGYSKGVFNVTSGANYSVIVGSGGSPSNNGGNSSFGNLISATGGGTGVTGEEIYNGPFSIAIGGHGTGGQISIQGGSNDADPSGGGSPNGGFGGVLNYDGDGDGQNGGSPGGGGGGGGDGVSTIGVAGQGGTGLVIVYY